MSDERHARVKEVFLAACEMAASRRGAFLDEACEGDPALRFEVESLLRFYEETATPQRDLGQRPGSRTMIAGDPPQTIGSYRILQKLGEGGMGEVYEAEQEAPIRRRVALKLIKWGMDTKDVLARFESERQALALMNHPNIAKVFEAGATDLGRPFFAMEYIKGVPITDYCDLERLNTNRRLALFAQVCQGVQHAHQKGVIHRDIKPSNILVAVDGGQPVPKIIDFGVAKATAQRLTEKTVFTQLGQWVGTPEYMSPEQAEMTVLDIDTRTDVYSLGVVLYELLSGALPFDPRELQRAGFDEMRRRIREIDPPKPSTRVSGLGAASSDTAGRRGTDAEGLVRTLRGDLDSIALKALEKDRTRRYASPADLASDIERYLKDEPVRASPPSGWYRARKFVRRHRIGVAAGSLVATALVAGLALASVLMLRAQRAERLATKQVELLGSLFESLNPLAIDGGAAGTKDFLAAGSDRIDRELADQPLIRARLKLTMAQTYLALGVPDQARPMLDASLAIREQLLGPDDPAVAEVLNVYGQLHAQTGEFETGLSLARRALAIRHERLGHDDALTAESFHNLCFFLLRVGDNEAAESACEAAHSIRERRFGPDHWTVADTLFTQGQVATAQADFERARGLIDRATRIFESTLGSSHAVVGFTTASSGHVLRNLGEQESAKAQFERSIEILEDRFGVDHYSLASPHLGLGDLAFWAHDYDLALEHYRHCLTVAEATLGSEHPDVRAARLGVAWALARSGDVAAAQRLYRDCVPGSLESIDRLSADPSRDCYNLGCLAALVGERDEALLWLQRAADRGFDRDVIFSDPDLDSLRGDPEFEDILLEVSRRQGD